MSAAVLLAALAWGAPAPEVALEGSAWRMSTPVAPVRLGQQLHLFAHREDCLAAGIPGDEVAACVPRVDAARGEVRVAIGLRDLHDPVPFALDVDRLRVSAPTPLQGGQVRVVGHAPAGYRQLFALVVDRSTSMYARGEGGRAPMEHLAATLLSDAVTTTFFPPSQDGSGDTGVLLLAFTDRLAGVDGRPWEDVDILTDLASYRAAVDHLLDRSRGYTHLYDAVRVTVDEVLVDRDVRRFVHRTQVDPAVVVLTDGFHHTRADQRCADNVAPLEETLASVRAARVALGRPLPVLSTVALGAPAWPGFTSPTRVGRGLDARLLCGDDPDTPVDPDLERRGSDNRSLALLAHVGGGRVHHAHVSADPATATDEVAGLAAFLAGTATRPHRWFEVHLQLPPQQLRRPLPVRLELLRSHALDAEVTLFPHPWLDLAPPREPGGGGAAGAAEVLVTGLGMTLGLLGLLTGGRNARRAVLRRARDEG